MQPIQPIQQTHINCPGCGVLLEVKNPTNAAVKDFKCPKCGKPIQARFRSPETATPAPAGPETQLGGKGTETAGEPTESGGNHGANGGDATQLISNQGQQPAAPRLVCNGKEYPLQAGMNTVGRRSQHKPATVMLNVEDPYMSRQHIAINVTRLTDGTTRATVRNHQNKNATQVAGVPLNKGDEVVLNNGTTIKMGDTEIIYRQ